MAASSGNPDLRVENGVVLGSAVVAKPKHGWMYSRYIFGKVTDMSPLRVTNASGIAYVAKDLEWVILAEDDGWLEPYDVDWQDPGRLLWLQLLNREWVSAKVAADHTVQAIKSNDLNLKIEGIEGLSSVCVQTDVAFIFTANAKCLDEFVAKPFKGGCLHEHLAAAFVPDVPKDGSTKEEAQKAQSARWATPPGGDTQYPARCVWVHPQMKEGGLNEFARRAAAKKEECPQDLDSEIVFLPGPPAAGKSSASRLKAEDLTGSMAPLRKTASCLKDREEVNGDSLTDCMPGFQFEYRRALSVTGDNAWAITLLVYVLYHHGPVRDSLRPDVMKTTVVDAQDLAVFYTSSMKGAAVGQAMQIINWAQSTSEPVPHKRVPVRAFWPYTSQDARYTRMMHRAKIEAETGQLQGGNLTQNLAKLHESAQQAEINILLMLEKLGSGMKPCDDTIGFGGDHFIVVDNEDPDPKVLIDFVSEESATINSQIRQKLLSSVEEVITCRNLFEKTWDELDCMLFRVSYFLLVIASRGAPSDRVSKADSVVTARGAKMDIRTLQDALPILVELDEQVFYRKHKEATAVSTQKKRNAEQRITDAAKRALDELTDDDVACLQKHISILRKYTCCAILRSVKDGGSDWAPIADSPQDLTCVSPLPGAVT